MTHLSLPRSGGAYQAIFRVQTARHGGAKDPRPVRRWALDWLDLVTDSYAREIVRRNLFSPRKALQARRARRNVAPRRTDRAVPQQLVESGTVALADGRFLWAIGPRRGPVYPFREPVLVRFLPAAGGYRAEGDGALFTLGVRGEGPTEAAGLSAL